MYHSPQRLIFGHREHERLLLLLQPDSLAAVAPVDAVARHPRRRTLCRRGTLQHPMRELGLAGATRHVTHGAASVVPPRRENDSCPRYAASPASISSTVRAIASRCIW